MTERWKEQVFEELEPPPGGLSRVRTRIDTHNARGVEKNMRSADGGTGPWFGRAAVLGALAVAVAMLFVLSRAPSERGCPAEMWGDPAENAHPALVHYGLARAPEQPVTIAPARRHTSAAIRVPVERTDVVFYWVSSAKSN